MCGIFLSADGAPREGSVLICPALLPLLLALLYLHALPVLVVVDDEDVLTAGVDRLLGEYLAPHCQTGSAGPREKAPGLKFSESQVSTVEYFLLDESVLSKVMIHPFTEGII